jgi:hypothetical protein
METGITIETAVNGNWTIQIVGHGRTAIHIKNTTLFQCALKALKLLTPNRAFALPPKPKITLVECNLGARTATLRVS